MHYKNISRKIFYSLFPFLELGKQNLSITKKINIWIDIIVMAYLVAYILLFWFSHVFYKYELNNGHIQLYANRPLDSRKVQNTLSASAQQLSKLKLYDPHYRVKIFLVDNRMLFRFQTFFRDVIAGNIFDSIYIDNNFLLKSEDYYEFLYTEIVHEITHTFQAHRYGGWIKSTVFVPSWVKEGYAVYVSRKKLSNNFLGFLKTCREKNCTNLSLSDTYHLNGLLVKYAIEKMHVSVDDLHRGKVDYDRVLDSLLKEYNITRYKQPEEPSSE